MKASEVLAAPKVEPEVTVTYQSESESESVLPENLQTDLVAVEDVPSTASPVQAPDASTHRARKRAALVPNPSWLWLKFE